MLLGSVACGGNGAPEAPTAGAVSSRAYKGHADDRDINLLVAAYPEIAGTRLDDCQSCHTGGEVTVGGRARFQNACDYCHFIPYPDDAVENGPAAYADTLNPFGLAYLRAGRDAAAIAALETRDSDGDGFANGDEIRDLRYPGSRDSKPGQPRAQTIVLDLDDLRAMPAHTEFLLANAHSQRSDAYATYTGVRIRDLLNHLGVDADGISGITIVAADGYMKDFDAREIVVPYPNGLFFPGLDVATLGPDCGFVDYPATLPEGLTAGGEIPGEQWLMLAWARDGGALDASRLDPASGRIEGEGPLRIIVPQSRPGAPDRGSRYSPSGCADGRDLDEEADHNAGSMARAVVAIRVNPLPEGYEEFDARNGGWAYVDAGQLVVYGAGIE